MVNLTARQDKDVVYRSWHTSAEMEEAESPRELSDNLRHGAFDRRVSLRIPAPPGTMDVVWRGADGGEYRGEVSDISLRAVLFDAGNYLDETIVAVHYHPNGRRFGIQSYRTQGRGFNRQALVIEKFTDTITDRMNWIELLTRLDTDQCSEKK